MKGLPRGWHFSVLAFVIGWWLLGLQLSAAENTIHMEHPQPRQVIQRVGTDPGIGYAHVVVSGSHSIASKTATWEYRLSSNSEPASKASARWLPLRIETPHETRFLGEIRIPAGWWNLEVRCQEGASTLASTSVAPVGIGELFVVAGQSYATNTNDEKLTVTDQQQRVSAFDLASLSWRVANDPQPTPDGSDGGSIWPPLGDALVTELGVPIGLANVAVGGTSSQQWLPGGTLHPRLVEVGKHVGYCRAVLWQQGESDVIGKTPAEEYVANIRTIRDAAFAQWGYEVPWLLAKSTHHPTVYNDLEGEGRIRGAIDQLTKLPGYRAGPDTDTLQGENRGDPQSRRHFTGIGQRRAAELWRTAIRSAFSTTTQPAPLRVGIAAVDITPPVGFPMAGYYHERLAEGEIDPLQAKAIVFIGAKTSGALVVCDLIGIATDLKHEVRKRASEQTGIPPENISLTATHSHTAPDYMKELYLHLGNEPQEPLRAAYIDKLISGPVNAIVAAHAAAKPSLIEIGSTTQRMPVSFNRRSVMKDGTVRTWMSHDDPHVVRSAGPIDPEIAVLAIRNLEGVPQGVLSNFALHLDTVGGMKWSADYPFFIERTLRQSTGSNVISIFGTGCCGDINHVNPRSKIRNGAEVIGSSLGSTIDHCLRTPASMRLLDHQSLEVRSTTVHLPLQSADQDEIDKALVILDKARRKEPVDFYDHVIAHKKVMIDGLRHQKPHAHTPDHITWGLSRSLKGIGDKLPVDLMVITLGQDVAIVCLPGEAFVELGLAIKQGSPFRTTLVIELANAVETIYLPTRSAYAGGSYEVTNSATEAGSGEMLVEASLKLLREAAQGTP